MKRNLVVGKLIQQMEAEAAGREPGQGPESRRRFRKPGRIGQIYKPTAEISGFKVRPGNFEINGATEVQGGVNFTISSIGATSCELCLFKRHQDNPYAVIKIPDEYRIGMVYSIMVFGLIIEDFEYCYRFDGPYDPERGLLFDKTKLVLDPYARAVAGQRPWGAAKTATTYKARVVHNDFKWDDTAFPRTPMEDSIIYEMHVRGFTRHRSSGVQYPGTFAGIVEKIPYLKELGITAVELMPVFEFDAAIKARSVNGKQLMEYWGYNTVSFFAPNSAFAASLEYNEEGTELKQTIQVLKKHGIEVILDVVFNHTAEGNENGPFLSFKGLDNNIYYMLMPTGEYYNFSGCGNTFNCNNPIVRQFIINCLKYWVTEYNVDGFRFELASILGRDQNGVPMKNPPLLERLSYDPILRSTKLIAEAWDAGGLYQVGNFPAYHRWAEWNGKYRDALRDFLKGNYWNAPETAKRLAGSTDLYQGVYEGHESSVNFITCHDGFTLYDLFSYSRKHNEVNGWNNADGADDNRSWNCGVEGPTEDPVITALRFKMMRNAITVLMCSRGTPMILAGDEFGNTQFGNNNSYCQDNEISWLNWDYLKRNRDFFEFYKSTIAFRKKHPSIRRQLQPAECGLPDVMTCGANPDDHMITKDNRVLGILFAGREEGAEYDDVIYMVINAHWEPCEIRLPALRAGLSWGICIDTEGSGGRFYYEKPVFLTRPLFMLAERSVAVFTLYREEE